MNPVAWLRQRWRGRKAARVVAAYARALSGEDGRLMLADLAAFTKADESTFVAGDPYLSAHLEGMRRVFLHIQAMRGIDPRALTQPDGDDTDA